MIIIYIYIYIYIYTFFRIIQENKSLRKSYENYFIDRFKPLLNKKTEVAKPSKTADLNMS